MRRLSLLVLLSVLLSGTLIGVGRYASAQDAGLATHPAQGTWTVESDPGDAEYSPRLVMLSADGSAIFLSGYGTSALGVWEPTGDTTAAVTFTMVTNGPAKIVMRASIEIAPDGESFTGVFTNEFIFDPAGGGTSGELGPGTLEGTRMEVEAPGTPVASFEEFFPNPEATPVS